MDRRITASVAAACGLAGAAAGFSLGDARPAPPHGWHSAALRVVSRYRWHDRDSRILVVAGALGSDPRRGFVLFQATTSERDPIPPGFFTMPDRSGPLRIVASSQWAWVLEASDGTRAALSTLGELAGSSFFVLGKPLDPAHLPALTGQGVAVPATYGPRRRKAVILAGFSRSDQTWHPYGYLPGFSLPPPANATRSLDRLLLGSDGRLYRVDPALRRMVPRGRYTGHRPLPERHPGCSAWPQPSGDRYLACSWSIVLTHPDGTRRTIARARPLGGGGMTGWGFLEPSPDGRTLLLEHDDFGCGVYPQAASLRVADGGLQFPVTETTDSEIESEPLGWLRDGSALLAVQNDEGCEGAIRSGIYRVRPGGTAPLELVLETSATDATTWGAGSW